MVRRSTALAGVVKVLEQTLHLPLDSWPDKPVGLLRPHLGPQPLETIAEGQQRLAQLFRARWLPAARLEAPWTFPDAVNPGSFQIVYAAHGQRYEPVRALPVDDSTVRLLQSFPDVEQANWGYFAGDLVKTIPHEFAPGEVHPVLTEMLAPGPRLPQLRLQQVATDL